MPFINDGSQTPPINPLDLIQLVQQIQNQRARQGQSLVDTAEPGATVGSIGLDPGAFAALYGRNTPYDRNRVIKPQTAANLADHQLQSFIQNMTPQQAADYSASLAAEKAGVPGLTTVQGIQDASAAGAATSRTKRQIEESTGAQQVQTAKAKASSDYSEAQTKALTSQDVLTRTVAGIDAWNKAPAATQMALNQKLTYGTTQNELDETQSRAALATSAIKQAIIAQTDPRAPIHAFLAKNGLDLNTVLAGSAMGITSMFSDYSRYLQESSLTNRQQSNIMLQMYTQSARDMSEKVFGGKITPGQVLTIMKSREDGTPLPRGLEAAASVYDRGVQATFDANMQDLVEKGDPMLKGMMQTIGLLGKQTDPSSLSEVADLTRRAAAYAATAAQMGRPTTPAQEQAFNDLWKKNYQRAVGINYSAPWFSSNSWNITGGANMSPDPSTVPDAIKGVMAPRAAAPTGTQPVNFGPAGVPASPTDSVTQAFNNLSSDDQNALANYLKTLGITPGAGKPPGQ